jgi:hypothetical protein
MGGSRDGTYENLADDVYRWDLRDDRVTRRNSMPKKVVDMAVVVYRDKIYGVSGFSNVTDSFDSNDETLCYSITDDKWSVLPLGRYEPTTEKVSLIALGDFIYATKSENVSIHRLSMTESIDIQAW